MKGEGVRALPSGRFSIPCDRCGKRHVQRYSDDFVWCLTCRIKCEQETDHIPDEGDPTQCFRCGQFGLPKPPPEEFEDCPTCHGEGQIRKGESTESLKR